MPVLTIRCNHAAMQYLIEQAGESNLSEFCRERLGIAHFHDRRDAGSKRLWLKLSGTQKTALVQAVHEHGFANVSAYVRARLFLSPPPAAPIVTENESDITSPVRLVLRDDDRRRIAQAARGKAMDSITYVMRRVFTDVE